MLRWAFIFTALAIIALIIVLLLVSLAQEHKHLRSVQEELGRTNQQVVKLEKVIGSLKADLDVARAQLKEKENHAQERATEHEKARKEAEERLAAEREASQRQFEALTKAADEGISKVSEQLKLASAQVEQLTRERDAAQSKLESTNAELAKAKEAAEQANTKAT